MDIADRLAEQAFRRINAIKLMKHNRSMAWRARYAPAVKPAPKHKCEAKTRAGTPCRRTALENGRCPNHGGLSTGPKTERGRKRIAKAQRRRWKLWREAALRTPGP
jgi:hypothetical protein